MKNVDVKNVEVSDVKNKYKKLRNIVLLTILVLLVIFVIHTSYELIILNKIFENNLDVDYGDNYKEIRISDGQKTVHYCKGNKSKIAAGPNGENVMMWDGDKAYLVVNDKKEYYEYVGENQPMMYNGGRKTVTTFNTIMISREQVDTLLELIEIRFSVFKMNVGIEEMDGKEYYVIETDSDVKMWFNKDDYRLVKEMNYGRVSTVEVIEDVVTDEDMILPSELGYKRIEATITVNEQ